MYSNVHTQPCFNSIHISICLTCCVGSHEADPSLPPGHNHSHNTCMQDKWSNYTRKSNLLNALTYDLAATKQSLACRCC